MARCSRISLVRLRLPESCLPSRSTVQMSSGRRKPLLMPVGVQRILLSAMRYEWLPSLPAQKPLSQMRRPISHICSFNWNSPSRWVPLPLELGLVPYAMDHQFIHANRKRGSSTLSYGIAWRAGGTRTRTCPAHRDLRVVIHHRKVEDRRAIRVDRHALLRVERHAGLAALGEGDQLAVAGAEVVVDHQRLGRLPRLSREHVPVLYLDDEEPAADERVVQAAHADAANDSSDSHAFSTVPLPFVRNM